MNSKLIKRLKKYLSKECHGIRRVMHQRAMKHGKHGFTDDDAEYLVDVTFALAEDTLDDCLQDFRLEPFDLDIDDPFVKLNCFVVLECFDAVRFDYKDVCPDLIEGCIRDDTTSLCNSEAGESMNENNRNDLMNQAMRLQVSAINLLKEEFNLKGGEAEEVFYRALMKFTRTCEAFDPRRGSFKNYFFGAVRNTAREWLRERNRYKTDKTDEDYDQESVEKWKGSGSESEKKIDVGILLLKVREILNECNERDKVSIVLFYIYDFKDKEIAEIMNIPGQVNNIRVWRGRIIDWLGVRLRQIEKWRP